jgi:ATP-dependent Clp protease protease subunit
MEGAEDLDVPLSRARRPTEQDPKDAPSMVVRCGGPSDVHPNVPARQGRRLLNMGLEANLPDSVYERLRRERIIVLGCQIEEKIASRICADLLFLSAERPDEDIRLYINSPGGSVTAGMAIYDTMHLIEPDVATYAMGIAAGMAQVLLSAGARGKRYALSRARILMQEPSAGVSGTAADIVIQTDMLIKHKREMAELIAEQTGQPVERIIADSKRERWFTSHDARDYGFVDQVLTLPDR